MIVLHRRGTTGEWQQADILAAQVPDVLLKDGEFAIEECEDGSRRVKIGDGHTKFYALPYIDGRAEASAEELVHAAKAELLKRIESTSAEQKALIKNNYTDLSNKCSTKLTAISTAYQAADAAIAEELKNTISDQLDGLHSELVEESSGAKMAIADLNSKLSTTENKLISYANSNNSKLNKLSENLDSLSKTVTNTVTKLDADLESCRTETVAVIDAKTRELNSALLIVEKDISNLATRTDAQETSIISTKAYFENKLAADRVKSEESIAEVRAALEAADTALGLKVDNIDKRDSAVLENLLEQLVEVREEVSHLNAADGSLLDTIYSVNNRLTSIVTKLSEEVSKVDALAAKHSTDISAVIKNIADLDASQQAANLSIVNKITEHVSDIYRELADLVDDDILILEKVFSTENILTSRLNRIEATLSNAVAKLNEISPDSLDVVIASLEAQITDVATETNSKFSELTVEDPLAGDESDSNFINTIKQESGKIIATKAKLPIATSTTAGIATLGVDGGAASYIHAKENTDEIAKLKLAVAGTTHFIGTTDTLILADSHISPIVVEGAEYIPVTGDIVLAGNKEFIWSVDIWKELGDLSRISTMELWREGLNAPDVSVVNQFITSVSQADGKVSVTRSRPSASDIEYNSNSLSNEIADRDRRFAELLARCLQFNTTTNNLYVGDATDDSIIFYCGTATDI